MNIFYGNIIDKKGTLASSDIIHATKVLRKKEGGSIYITNGEGTLAQGTIQLVSKKTVEVLINSTKTFPKPKKLHIAIAPTKSNDRFEFFLEKATEIGISEITPIICYHSERKKINIERYQKILIAAIKQSQNFHLPKLNDSLNFNQFITQAKAKTKYIAHCENETKKALIEKDDVLVLIGPEGDFSLEEINLAIQNGYVPLTLGNSRLRTETAGIVTAVLFNNEQ